MNNINDTIAASLFEKIRNQFEKIAILDEKGKAPDTPNQARAFNFDYVDSLGNNFGSIHVSLSDRDHNLKIIYGKNLSANLDDDQKKEWYSFLRDLRLFAMRNRLKFDVRDISRSSLHVKDLQQLSAENQPDNISDESVTESRLYGRSGKTSYENIAPGTKLIIRHSDTVDETIHGARSRKIHAVYVEDAEGQRFKSPFTHLGGARVLGRHIAHGGTMNDEFAEHVIDLVQEMGKIRKFIQGTKNKTFEDNEANGMIEAAKDRHKTLHQTLHKLKGTRGYHSYKEDWKPAKSLQDDIDHEALRAKFTQSNFDNRLEDALPHVYRAYHNMQKNAAQPVAAPAPEMRQFESHMDSIAEGTWAVPDSDLAVQHLQELMADVLVAGVDGANATSALYDLIGDDQLFDDIYKASQGSPEMDVRPIIFDWLKLNMPNVGTKIEANMEQGGVKDTAEPAVDPDTPIDPQTGKEAPAPEEAEEEQPPPNESRNNTGKMINEYYTVESDSAPFFIHSTKFLDSARRQLANAKAKGNVGAAIYEVHFVEGHKVRTKLKEAQKAPKQSQNITESTQLSDIRRLAGLNK